MTEHFPGGGDRVRAAKERINAMIETIESGDTLLAQIGLSEETSRQKIKATYEQITRSLDPNVLRDLGIPEDQRKRAARALIKLKQSAASMSATTRARAAADLVLGSKRTSHGRERQGRTSGESERPSSGESGRSGGESGYRSGSGKRRTGGESGGRSGGGES
ncbi:MAG TPA: hypothetical protein VFQ60_04560 [Patescibacteria group bacterium]|nr:hypothetical protein [Patescibacteria group bacterium]